MFAVPGWSVASDALKSQVLEVSKSAARPSLSSPHSVSDVAGRAGKKRKRSGGASEAPVVNAANLSELWQTVIEKNISPKVLKKAKSHVKKKSKRKAKLDDLSGNKTSDKAIKATEMFARREEIKEPRKKSLDPTEDLANVDLERSETRSTVEPSSNLTPLQNSMRQKLISARFRHLNQTLYTNPSAHSLALFHEHPEMFQEYHEGFRRQVEVWPENPLDGYVAQIKRRGMKHNRAHTNAKDSANSKEQRHSLEVLPLPRSDGICHIADLGCGDGSLSKTLEGLKKKLRLKVFSFDLQSPNELVTQADIAELPLKDGSIEIAIFCLALMGTNWIDFIEEAYRVMRWKGELWVAEIKSRFGRARGEPKRVDHSIGNRKSRDLITKGAAVNADDTDNLLEIDVREEKKGEMDVSAFVEVLRKRGFTLQNDEAIDLSNKMFVRFHFVKSQTPIKGKFVPVSKGGVGEWMKRSKGRVLDEEETQLSSEAAVLKPCVYKLR